MSEVPIVSSDGLDDGIRFTPPGQATLSREEAACYLGLPMKSLQRLAEQRELIPLTYCRPHRFSLAELDRFIAASVKAERERREDAWGRSTCDRNCD